MLLYKICLGYRYLASVDLDIVIVTLVLPELPEAEHDGGLCVCMRMTERTSHHRHISIFIYLSLLL